MRLPAEPSVGTCVLSSLIFFVLVSAPELARGGDPLVAAFDWSMPDRLGLDRNPSDGVIDALVSPDQIDPGDWEVLFDACESSASASMYRWSVDGAMVGEASVCDAFAWVFPAEGVYRVGLEVVADGRSASVERDVVVQDWLVVALGDSYGSGEGNPDAPIGEASYQAWETAAAALEDAVSDAATAAAELAEAQDAVAEVVMLASAVRAQREVVRSAEQSRDRACSNFPFLGCPAAELALNEARLDLLDALAAPLLALDPLALVENLNDIEVALLTSEGLFVAALDLAASAFASRDALRVLAEDGVDEALGGLESTWQNRRCHRSAKSGQALAALEIERADPRTSVTLVHLACSGARITTGLLLADGGAEEAEPGELAKIPAQMEEVRRLVGNREIDAVVMSIGGNDARFSDVVQACVGYEPCHRRPTRVDTEAAEVADGICRVGPLAAFAAPCIAYISGLAEVDPLGPNAAEIFQAALAGRPPSSCGLDDQLDCASLSARYDALQARFERWPGFSSDRVFITEYPSVTIDDDGSFCLFDPGSVSDMLPGWSAEESMWAETDFLPQLNAVIADAADRHSWRYVDGPAADFVSHGYCADDNWIIRLDESLLTQGPDEPFEPGADARVNGTAHPNEEGHRAYARRITAALRSDFYLGADLSHPRAPNPVVQCAGDCDGDRRVSIAELIVGVNIALGSADAHACLPLDVDGNGRISIAELVRAVNAALSGCA